MALFCFAKTEFGFSAWGRKVGKAVGGQVIVRPLMKHNRSRWQINALGKDGIEETFMMAVNCLCCVLGCHGYGVTVRKREAKRVREDDFLFHHADGSARCSRNRVCCALPWQPEIWKGAEKNDSMFKPELLSLFFKKTMQCKMQIRPVIQIWVYEMKKIRVSHFQTKGVFSNANFWVPWEPFLFLKTLFICLSFHWDEVDSKLNKVPSIPHSLYVTSCHLYYQQTCHVNWDAMCHIYKVTEFVWFQVITAHKFLTYSL
jgi:hypothetical protein